MPAVDVQAEAYDWPLEFLRKRVWHVARLAPQPAALARVAAVIRTAERSLLVAGGSGIYSEGSAAVTAFADATGIPVADTEAGKSAISFEHPWSVGAIGSTGNDAANALVANADVVIGLGTRSDFTTASHTAFGNPDVRFVNLGAKLAAPDSEVAIVADGGFQMQPQEIAMIVSENLKVIIAPLQNHGSADCRSPGVRSCSVRATGFAVTARTVDGANTLIDLAGNA